MPFSGGTYTPPGAPAYPPAPGDVISSSYYVQVTNDIATALSQTQLRDGSVAWTGDQNCGNHSLTGINVGAVGTPGINFQGYATTGFYIDVSGNLCFARNGVQVFKLTATGVYFKAQDFQTLSPAVTTLTPNLDTGANFNVAMAGNYTLANPSALTAGETGVIVFTQDGTGSRTLAYGSYWLFPNGAGGKPALSTTAAAVDVLSYQVISSTQIACSLTKAYG